MPLALLGLGLAAAVLWGVSKMQEKKTTNTPGTSGDMGPGLYQIVYSFTPPAALSPDALHNIATALNTMLAGAPGGNLGQVTDVNQGGSAGSLLVQVQFVRTPPVSMTAIGKSIAAGDMSITLQTIYKIHD